MATSSPEGTAIGVAQATGTGAAAAVLVYVVSLYCGAGYLDLPFETGRSKVVLRINFETDMRACFQAFHPNARVLNMNIGLQTVVDVIRAIRELVPPGARLHLKACLPCNHSSGTSGKRKHYSISHSTTSWSCTASCSCWTLLFSRLGNLPYEVR